MDAPLAASLIESAITAGVVLVLAFPAFFRRRRALVLVAVALTFLDSFATAWPNFRGSSLAFIGGHWNWSGKLIDLAVLLLVAALFVVTGLFTRRESGLTFAQRPGTGRAVLFVIVPYMALIAFVAWKLSPHEVPTAETLAFEATLPGLTEELFFRGLLLALFDRMFPPGRMIFGATMGYGAIATSIAFAAVHAFGVGRSLRVEFALLAAIPPLLGALVGAWIRARSGSLLVPVLSHNVSNVVAEIAPMFV